jgi:hypothetical protein
MRLGPLVFVLAACSGSASASAGPAWPKPAAREIDGGESLAPRGAARPIAAREDDEKAGEDCEPGDQAASAPPAEARSTGTGSSTADEAAASTPEVTSPDEPITAEEIVIEIEDEE